MGNVALGKLLAILSLLLLAPTTDAQSTGSKTVEYELVISEVEGAPAGNVVPVLVVNGTSPGPVLRFREGDTARITVKNRSQPRKPPSAGTVCSCPTKWTASHT